MTFGLLGYTRESHKTLRDNLRNLEEREALPQGKEMLLPREGGETAWPHRRSKRHPYGPVKG